MSDATPGDDRAGAVWPNSDPDVAPDGIDLNDFLASTEKDICLALGLDALPEQLPSGWQDWGGIQQALSAAVDLRGDLKNLAAAVSYDPHLVALAYRIAERASRAAYFSTVHRYRSMAPDDWDEFERRRSQTAAATAARTNTARVELAEAHWDANPDWSTHRVAVAIAEAIGGDVSSIHRSIRHLKPLP